MNNIYANIIRRMRRLTGPADVYACRQRLVQSSMEAVAIDFRSPSADQLLSLGVDISCLYRICKITSNNEEHHLQTLCYDYRWPNVDLAGGRSGHQTN